MRTLANRTLNWDSKHTGRRRRSLYRAGNQNLLTRQNAFFQVRQHHAVRCSEGAPTPPLPPNPAVPEAPCQGLVVWRRMLVIELVRCEGEGLE